MALFGKILAALLLTPIVLLAVMVFRAEVYFPRPGNDDTCNATHTPIAGDELVQRFSSALKIKTVTRGLGDYDGEPRIEFAQFLRKSMLCHALFSIC